MTLIRESTRHVQVLCHLGPEDASAGSVYCHNNASLVSENEPQAEAGAIDKTSVFRVLSLF